MCASTSGRAGSTPTTTGRASPRWRRGADLVVLPEAFARDFGQAGSDVSPFAEPVDGPFAREVARVADATVVHRRGRDVRGRRGPRPGPSTPSSSGGPSSATYRKIHLYDSFGYRESDRLTGGPVEPVVVDVAGWQVGLMTCYDLRFPELARRWSTPGPRCSSCRRRGCPVTARSTHWRTLLAARAIENTCFVVGAGQPEPRYSGTPR